jgi:hypothetical protein
MLLKQFMGKKVAGGHLEQINPVQTGKLGLINRVSTLRSNFDAKPTVL